MSNDAILYFTMGEKFLRLARSSIDMLIETNNQHFVFSNKPLSSNEYDKATEWSDFHIGVPVLFNFYHSIELMLKGSISLKDSSFNSHRFSELVSRYIDLYSRNELIERISECTVSMPSQYETSRNLMKDFLDIHNIDIDLWYQALKYPVSTKGMEFDHLSLKYGSNKTLDFWKRYSFLCDDILKKSARFYHSFK